MKVPQKHKAEPHTTSQGKKGLGFAANTNYPVQRSPGEPLEKVVSTASKVLNHDFSGVNIELNSKMPEKVGAVATAAGKQIKVAPSHSDLMQKRNVEVLGHEIRHTQQQDLGKVSANTQIAGLPVNNEQRHEQDANAAGKRIASAL
ncbi:MAG TPA: DUF4157 domain-containing protein [Bacteroidetes bacterium]|nr:DUF4157 domain-containing protein [Bacteroidota bacterium]